MNCPACKSERHVEAEAIVPRLEQGVLVCLDCGNLYIVLVPWVRGRLIEDWEKRIKEEGEIVALGAYRSVSLEEQEEDSK